MIRSGVVLSCLVSCVWSGEPEPLSETESAVTSPQGTSYQGTSYQGTSYQGTSYQGTSYQGTSYQGGSYGGTAAQYVSVTNTELSFWKLGAGLWPWEQHFPDRICNWNVTRTVRLSCRGVNLATTASPLAGLSIPSTFVRSDGSTFTGTVKVDTGIGAVHHDSDAAMFAPNGAIAASCPSAACTNPNGCRKNCDLWLYNLHLYDTSGASLLFCPAGESAMALAGTWDATGAFSSSTTRFTFACTSGTIAKCTRWGYRPFDTGTKLGTTTSLAPYHQACIRAATADYCANGHSFTKDHTLVDVSDGGFIGNPPVFDGFISRTLWTDPTATAYAWESDWDTLGAITMDRMRYQELSGTPSYGSIGDPGVGCPGRFDFPSAPGPNPIDYPQHPSTRISPP
ncbi:MAG TPA: ADYC domain-containing protein, partial [Kofleriaceae bacterium]|nr:ADYC domain-containing protein [Kofleriaceae bacterium]